MLITASQIVEWVNTNSKEAQISLPRLIRRLCYDPSETKALSFPAGDSTYKPGWDGISHRDKGNAWVPEGTSYWEMGCDKGITSKAHSDLSKRTASTPEEIRKKSHFIFVTPRRWSNKDKWIKENSTINEWKGIKAFDADDLEQWLEQNPVVSQQFAEELGIYGYGVESLEKNWLRWSAQCSPAITSNAFFRDRKELKESFISCIRNKLLDKSLPRIINVKAESIEEAVAFATCSILSSSDLRDQALCITSPNGWKYIDTNKQINISISTCSETSSAFPANNEFITIIPSLSGGSHNRSKSTHNDMFVLNRISIYEFEKSLIDIGIEESDSKRFALTTGRSWTIYRRRFATNLAIKNPDWIDSNEAKSLAAVCLLGDWSQANENDRKIIERLSRSTYDDFEKNLLHLSKVNDSPLIRIGDIWKAKSPLELLDLFGERVTSDQLDEFFKIAEEILLPPDPKLELPESQRHAAQIYRKTRPHSGLLIESLCDSLVKLSARGSDMPGLQSKDICVRVDNLIYKLFNDANSTRWLSLASLLPELAEASPDSFITSIEKSLNIENPPIFQLILETNNSDSSGITGICWHSGLLWALERLAWSPRRMARVALILAKLTHVEYKSNWSNKPLSSLVGIFRTWLPQTAATCQQRLESLELIVKKDPDAAFDLTLSLCDRGQQFVTPAASPSWRDDNSGTRSAITHDEVYTVYRSAKKHLYDLCKNNALRISRALNDSIGKDKDDISSMLPLIAEVSDKLKNEDRESIRKRLRDIIHWHTNYDDTPKEELDIWIDSIEACYTSLAPQDPVDKNKWLFEAHFVQLPEDKEDISHRGETLLQRRIEALNEIYNMTGFGGIEDLIKKCEDSYTVGSVVVKCNFRDINWSNWILNNSSDFCSGSKTSIFTHGLLLSIEIEEVTSILQATLKSPREKWPLSRVSNLFTISPRTPEIWSLLERNNCNLEKLYWNSVEPPQFLESEALIFSINKFLQYERPRSALQCCQYKLEDVDPTVLLEILQEVSKGKESNRNLIQGWHLGKAIDRLEQSEEIDRDKLMSIEFSLFPALMYSAEDKPLTLYRKITSDPKLLSELICICYKPRNSKRDEAPNAALVETAHSVLNECKKIPSRNKEIINYESLESFVDDVRAICSKKDRLAVSDHILGEMLARSPSDDNDQWPCLVVRDLLDRPEMEEVRNGFRLGIFNKRGVTTRMPTDGGIQERELAAYYYRQAERCRISHPFVAATLDESAKNYEYHGRLEDESASLSKETY